MSTTTAPITADEFLKQLDSQGQRLELMDGELPSGGPAHEQVKANLNRILVAWLLQHRVGEVYNESGYRLDDRIVQVPDLSVLGTERLKLSIEERFRGAPDLAVEVVSSETAERLQAKIRLYFKTWKQGRLVDFSGVPDRSRKPPQRTYRRIRTRPDSRRPLRAARFQRSR